MIQIRRGVFETNSSSTHSICITKDKRNVVIPARLHFALDGFGWECRKLQTPEAKAAYLYSGIWSVFDKKKARELTDRLYEMLSEEEIDCDFEEPVFVKYGDYEWCDNASVDHAGEDDHLKFIEACCGNKNRLMRYLFSDDSFVLTGNDNDDEDVDINVNYDHEEYYKGN